MVLPTDDLPAGGNAVTAHGLAAGPAATARSPARGGRGSSQARGADAEAAPGWVDRETGDEPPPEGPQPHIRASNRHAGAPRRRRGFFQPNAKVITGLETS